MSRMRVPCAQCEPLFSDADADLRSLKWWTSRGGYAIRSTTRVKDGMKIHANHKAHRIVLSRILGREITSADVCDHFNGNRLDNRRDNLSAVSGQQNNQNKRSWCKSGHRGVSFDKYRNKWRANVQHNGRLYSCGRYDSPEDAAEAARAKREELGFLGEDPDKSTAARIDRSKRLTSGRLTPRQYDWAVLFDGRVHELRAGHDFPSRIRIFRNVVRVAAKRLGIDVRVTTLHAGVAIQAIGVLHT